MIFSPLLVVATASLLSSSATAGPTLFARQQQSGEVADPHTAPDVPSNHTTPIANGGNWKEAFAKAQAVVEQMSAFLFLALVRSSSSSFTQAAIPSFLLQPSRSVPTSLLGLTDPVLE
jgi:hypothetical protein